MTLMKIFIIFGAIVIFMTGATATAVSAQKRSVKKQSLQKVQNVRVEITQAGYKPSSFKLKKGIRTRLTFVRKTEDECGKEVVIQAYNIRRELPLNQPVTVNFTPKKSGSFSFVCGMNMMRGRVFVQ